MTNKRQALSILFFCLIFTATVAMAESAKDIQQRMKSRIASISSLKSQQILGENNLGYLEFRGKKAQVEMVSNENNDRKLIYQAIAKKQKVTTELVGKRRAMTISKKGKATWLYQDSNGKWYQK